MLDYALLVRARKMLAVEATRLHKSARLSWTTYTGDAISEAITAEACDYASQSLHNVLAKADAFLDDEQAREALRHE